MPFTDAVVRWPSCKKSVLKNFAKFTGKHMCWIPFFLSLQACNFIKKRLQHRRFPVNLFIYLFAFFKVD